MWMLFGGLAIGTMLLNLWRFAMKKRCDWARYVSLSCTALTVCAFYAQSKTWVLAEDWSALMDVLPTVSTLLWVLVVLSIVLNGLTLLRNNR